MWLNLLVQREDLCQGGRHHSYGTESIFCSMTSLSTRANCESKDFVRVVPKKTQKGWCWPQISF